MPILDTPSKASDAGPDCAPQPAQGRYSDRWLDRHDEAGTWLDAIFSDRMNRDREKFAMHLRWLRAELDAMEQEW